MRIWARYVVLAVALVSSSATAQTLSDNLVALSSTDTKKSDQATTELVKHKYGAPDMLRAFRRLTSDQRIRALRRLQDTGEPAVVDAARSIALDDAGWTTRMEAIELIGRSTESANDVTLEKVAINDGHRFNRAMAVRWISKRQGKNSRKLLRRLLEDNDRFVSANAARELGRYGEPGAREKAIELVQDSDLHVRSSAVEALGLAGERTDIPRLKNIAADSKEHQHVRVAAQRSVKQIEYAGLSAAEKFGFLEGALNDQEWAVRTWAVSEFVRAYRDHPSEFGPKIDALLSKSERNQNEQFFQLKQVMLIEKKKQISGVGQ